MKNDPARSAQPAGLPGPNREPNLELTKMPDSTAESGLRKDLNKK